jgi:hypothetical protein
LLQHVHDLAIKAVDVSLCHVVLTPGNEAFLPRGGIVVLY